MAGESVGRGEGARTVPIPGAGFDARLSLTTALHSAPGVYAVLAGSGFSRAAGLSTGWEVVQDLIRRVAVAQGVDEAVVGDAPERWWVETRGVEPRYDDLLLALAPTDGLRRAVLKDYFDPPASSGAVASSSAHSALADLCARGRIRVVLTTNFDRLIERSLDAAGVGAQVIATADQLSGMTPLAHASTTVVKLHGDYAAPMLNTAEELGEYPAAMRELLDRVFDEYGVIVVGWSAEYDTALVGALAAGKSRRYPTYWASYRGAVTESARRLIDLRQASVVDTDGADELFSDLAERLARLDARALRRGKPTPLLAHYFPPERTRQEGWTTPPRLLLRAVACVGPATADSGPIGPSEREHLLSALRSAPLAQTLGGLFFAAAPRVDDRLEEQTAPVRTIEQWSPTPGAHQSSAVASYRFGGDVPNVSALVSVRMPLVGTGVWVVLTVDVGMPFAAPMRLAEAARLWRDALVLASGQLAQAVALIVPPDADVQHAELHAHAGTPDEQESPAGAQPDLGDVIDLTPLGRPTGALGSTMSFAMALAQAPTGREVAEVVVEAIYRMALAHGFLDPRNGIAALRAELGLPPAIAS